MILIRRRGRSSDLRNRPFVAPTPITNDSLSQSTVARQPSESNDANHSNEAHQNDQLPQEVTVSGGDVASKGESVQQTRVVDSLRPRYHQLPATTVSKPSAHLAMSRTCWPLIRALPYQVSKLYLDSTATYSQLFPLHLAPAGETHHTPTVLTRANSEELGMVHTTYWCFVGCSLLGLQNTLTTLASYLVLLLLRSHQVCETNNLYSVLWTNFM